MTSKLDIREGTFPNGLAYLSFGSGSPLIALPGSTAENGNLSGSARKFMVKPFLALGERHTVYVVNRRPGLAAGTTMSDITTDLAEALQGEFGEPVDVLGYSTGGSVAQQLALGHPKVVRRLVVTSSAYTLSPSGRSAMRQFAERAAAGKRPATAFAAIASTSKIAQRMMAGLLWMLDPMMRPSNGDYTDGIRVIEAEDQWDIKDRLAEIQVPAMVLGGDKDLAYPAQMFRDTADGIPGATLVLYEGRNHNSAIEDRRFPEDVAKFLEA
ncbi:alpha/beta fold hydrolase [Nocardia sp. XZ_19_385]|uniref:alpha/beta fold hydrolase n=1 Tax=Nocardia sp. XZ_19_385 TaxID=2769488 RepID=UPI00188F6A79|nr:alpha/beta hydrolase [Nocardia sp. XZ_19_385]